MPPQDPPLPPNPLRGPQRTTDVRLSTPTKPQVNGPVPYPVLVEAIRAVLPGQFDQTDPSQLIRDWLADFPEFERVLDHTTSGSERPPLQQPRRLWRLG